MSPPATDVLSLGVSIIAVFLAVMIVVPVSLGGIVFALFQKSKKQGSGLAVVGAGVLLLLSIVWSALQIVTTPASVRFDLMLVLPSLICIGSAGAWLAVALSARAHREGE